MIISIEEKGKIIKTECDGDANLLDVLRVAGASIPAYCNGNGTCGKCLVHICDATGNNADTNAESTEVLACSVKVSRDLHIRIPEYENVKDISVDEISTASISSNSSATGTEEDAYIVVDLGTTTIAAALYSSDGNLIKAVSEMNCLENYGADVISRTQYIITHGDGLSELSNRLREQVDRLSAELLAGSVKTDTNSISRKMLAGNTIMQHIFAGISPESISRAPFIPETLFADAKNTSEISVHGYKLTPCVAGYVGGDIVAGLYYLKHQSLLNGNVLFLDIGTNGEMGLFSNGKIYTAAVACGPAFEGGQIICGMTGVTGAVDKVTVKNGSLVIHIIGQEANPEIEAKGVCGSGLLDLAAALLEFEIIDESGYLDEDVLNDLGISEEEIFINQKDVRMLQLAKAAVRAGIDTLLQECGLKYADLDALYIAGGFGTYLDKTSAGKIGMIPAECVEKTISLGNTSLKGLAAAALESNPFEHFTKIKEMCHYIELSGNKTFEELYIDGMSFE